MNMNVQNPKFSFTEDQTKQVLMTAYHLSQASEYIQETNGMMSLMFNSMAIELLDQAGLSQAFLDELGYTKTTEPKIQLNKKEQAEVDSLFDEILNGSKSTTKVETEAKVEAKTEIETEVKDLKCDHDSCNCKDSKGI